MRIIYFYLLLLFVACNQKEQVEYVEEEFHFEVDSAMIVHNGDTGYIPGLRLVYDNAPIITAKMKFINDSTIMLVFD